MHFSCLPAENFFRPPKGHTLDCASNRYVTHTCFLPRFMFTFSIPYLRIYALRIELVGKQATRVSCKLYSFRVRCTELLLYCILSNSISFSGLMHTDRLTLLHLLWLSERCYANFLFTLVRLSASTSIQNDPKCSWRTFSVVLTNVPLFEPQALIFLSSLNFSFDCIQLFNYKNLNTSAVKLLPPAGIL